MPSEDYAREEEKKARTVSDLIRMRLERLQENINKPVSIPQRRDARKPKPPPDFVRNVVGSSAAAGSAEFHIFRNNRKREMDRVEYMEQTHLKEQLDSKFAENLRKQRELEEMKTAKKRKKRQRHKEKQRFRKKNTKESSTECTEDSDDSARSTTLSVSKVNGNRAESTTS